MVYISCLEKYVFLMKPEESDHYHSTICHPSAAAFKYYTYLKVRSFNSLITGNREILMAGF